MITLTKDNFDEVVANNALIVIDFWALWCGPCISFAPIFEKVAAKYPDITFAKVDIDQEPQLAADFNVRSIPQIVIMKEKIVVYSESGLLPISALQVIVEQAINLDLTEVHKKIDEENK